MKKPNKLLNKKYLSSLVIAAFLILSVLTAYNIRFGDSGRDAEQTEVEETLGDGEGVIRSGDGRNGEEGMTPDGDEESAGNGVGNDTAEDTDGGGVTGDAADRDAVRDAGDIRGSAGGRGEDSADASGETSDDSGKASDTSGGEEREEKNFSYDGSRKLPWPVMGNIILPYSMDTTVYYTTLDQYACNDGILIGAKKGEEVQAVADGRIVNIVESDRYGTMLTLLIGDACEVTYAQVENVKYAIGDEVEEGDVLATVAAPTRSFTLEGPHLFFKMTLKGEPVNPTEYLEA